MYSWFEIPLIDIFHFFHLVFGKRRKIGSGRVRFNLRNTACSGNYNTHFLKHEDPFAKGVAFCPGCSLELLLRFIPQVLGNDIIITGTPSCSAPVLLGQNMYTWHKLSYFGTLMTGAAANATGLVRYYRKAGIKNTVVCFNGDGTAADIGFGNLSGAAERNEPFIYICYDNEGYMNTGIQKSGTTPFGASTTTTPIGSASKGKNLRRMNRAHRDKKQNTPNFAPRVSRRNPQ